MASVVVDTGADVADGSSNDPALAVVGIVGALSVCVALAWLVASRGRGVAIGDWRDAERAAASFLRDRGCRRVRLTQAGADGGIDVMSDEWAVQVKHRSDRVGRPAVQQLVGAALAVDRRPALVSTSGFTKPAVEFAAQHDVALVDLDLDGQAAPHNALARQIGPTRRAVFRRR